MPFIAALPDELASKTASLFAVQGRYGNNALNGDWQLGMTSNTGHPPQHQINRSWSSGTSEPFAFTGKNGLDASFSLGRSRVQRDHDSQLASYEPNAGCCRTSVSND